MKYKIRKKRILKDIPLETRMGVIIVGYTIMEIMEKMRDDKQ